MALENPAKFNQLLGWIDAEAEAAPIQMKVARAKAEKEEEHKKSANNSLKRRT